MLKLNVTAVHLEGAYAIEAFLKTLNVLLKANICGLHGTVK